MPEPELPPGVYENLVTAALHRRLQGVDDDLVQRVELEKADTTELLVQHVTSLTRRALKIAAGSSGSVAAQVAVADEISKTIAQISQDAADNDDLIGEHQDVLLSLAAGRLPDGTVTFPQRPDIPLSSSALLVNGRDQPQIGPEVIKELHSADRVDLLIAFVKWHGLRLIEPALADFIHRGGTLRVITTTYMGATDLRAVDRLVSLGAEVAISYDTYRTRLHAKAWLFHRRSGLDTAYVGSSNLSRTAMLDGVEWNVRLARAEQPHLVDTIAATFEDYWNDPSFERYVPERDRERLEKALTSERTGATALPIEIANVDIIPWPYQQEVLETLQVARDNHNHWRNLVVMATGTGKTIVAALDYKRLREAGKVESLLFVAHRKDILTQSLATFRLALKDRTFGDLLVDGQRPATWRHVFASVQSLKLPHLNPDHFDMVIIDEFHHAAAKSYSALLDHIEPVALLGLTATPERTDGADILHWFDNQRPTAELRLWEALERGMLTPFHYFGIHDGVDVSSVTWNRRTGYDMKELENLYTGLDTRVDVIVQALQEKLGELDSMKAVGFCVSIKHAEFMADRFNKRGIPAAAITSSLDSQQRTTVLQQLRSGEKKIVFTVDLFNEGVDVPDINTILFLRPTESATIFLQQLGRGLRVTENKPVLTVLDFVGHQHKDFRFDKRFTALTGIRRGKLKEAAEAGFPTLPAGCSIDLDREVSKIVLSNIRQAITFQRNELIAELRGQSEVSLKDFLHETNVELADLYRGDRGGWSSLRRAAGLESRLVQDEAQDTALYKAIGRLVHVDDTERLDFLNEILTQPQPPSLAEANFKQKILFSMLNTAFDPNKPAAAIEEHLRALWANPARHEELIEVVDILHGGLSRFTPTVKGMEENPLRVHARYTRNEALAAFGVERSRSMVAGVRWVPDQQADVFFVTINKDEKHFSPTTMYNDRAISQTIFQWESQANTRESSGPGQRYINHAARGSTVHLFMREDNKGKIYDYAGPMTYIQHDGERPMRIIWELAYPLPAEVFHYAKVNSG
ncbi:DUF3427 domain-containing protein [Spirillospora sp. NPDC052242]